MSQVLLLGGTGVMGASLCRRLAEKGYDVVVTTRREVTEEGNVHYIRGNAKDLRFLRLVMQELKPDAVVDFMSYGSAEFSDRMDVLLNDTGQYMFVSSCRVFAGEEVHTERSPRLLDICTDAEYLKTDEYALAKARSENMLRDSGRRNWTIVRPCITYAYPRLQFGCLEANTFLPRIQQRLPVPIPAEMLRKRTTMLHGDVVAEMMSRLVLNERAIGEDFNAVTAENHTWEDVADIYAKAIGLRIAPCTITDYKTFCNPHQVQYGRMVHHCFDNSKVLAVTGMQQTDFGSLREMLAREAVKYLQNRADFEVDVCRNAKIDRILKTRFRVSGGVRQWIPYGCVRYPWLARFLTVALKIRNRL